MRPFLLLVALHGAQGFISGIPARRTATAPLALRTRRTVVQVQKLQEEEVLSQVAEVTPSARDLTV